jgi:hypothetical protein
MSKGKLMGMLDSMLEDSEMRQEAAAEEDRQREEAARKAAAAPKKDVPKERPAMTDVGQIAGLADGDVRKILAKAAPDDLLVLLAGGADPLQRRILGNLSTDSVKWMRENLAHMDEMTNAERESAEKKVLKVANKLLAEGEIGLPEAESAAAPDGPVQEEKDLRELLTDIVTIAAQAGPAALSEVLAASGEPLLAEGLELVLSGQGGKELRSELSKRRAALEKSYGQKLLAMEEAIVAIADGESPEAFRKRLFK